MAKLKTTTDSNRKINGNTFLLIITIALFAIMYIAGMVIFADKGFAKPQMFLNLFISNAGLLVIAVGQTIVMITGGIDISVGSITAHERRCRQRLSPCCCFSKTCRNH